MQGAGIRGGAASALHGFGIARVFGDQAGVVSERVLIGVIGPELGLDLARNAVDVFGGGDLRDLACPAAGGLDAEQVEGIAAVVAADFALAPTGLINSLIDQHLRSVPYMQPDCWVVQH